MMNNKLQRLIAQFMPFLIVGIVIAVFISVLILFSYALLWGVVIGGTIWLIALIKKTFFPAKKPSSPQQHQGRIIEHDDKTNDPP